MVRPGFIETIPLSLLTTRKSSTERQIRQLAVERRNRALQLIGPSHVRLALAARRSRQSPHRLPGHATGASSQSRQTGRPEPRPTAAAHSDPSGFLISAEEDQRFRSKWITLADVDHLRRKGIEPTLQKLNAMTLGGMPNALQRQLQTDEAAALSFQERLRLLVNRVDDPASSASSSGVSTPPSCAIQRCSSPWTSPHFRRLNAQQVLTLRACASNRRAPQPDRRHRAVRNRLPRRPSAERACRRGLTTRRVRMPRPPYDSAYVDATAPTPCSLPASRS